MQSKSKAVFLVLTCASALISAADLSAAPRLALSTNTVGPVNTVTGSNGPSQTVQALNLGDGSLTLTPMSSATWLSASVGTRGSCSGNGGNCYAVNIALNVGSLAGGTYTEFITLTDPNAIDAPQDIAVTVNTASVPASITAYVTPNGGALPKSLFNIFTTGTGVKGAVTTQSGGNWLAFVSGSGGLIPAVSPWLVQVAAPAGLGAGTYTGSVAISGSSVAADNKTIAVSMVITSSPILQLSSNSATRLVAVQGGTPQYAVVSFDNIGQGSLNVTGGSSSAKFLTASATSPNSLLVTADPTGLAPGIYNGTITVTSNAANNAQVPLPYQLVVAAAGAPAILPGGVVNISTYAQEAISPGDIAAIFGTQFAPSGTFTAAPSLPLATSLAGTQVLVNGVPAPLFFVSPGQVNFQAPYSLDPAQVNTVQVVAGGTQGNIRSIQVNRSMPRLLTRTGSYGTIVNATDGTLPFPTSVPDAVFKTHPAKPGDVIVIYAIGLGPTSPAAMEGQPSNDGTAGKPLQSIANVMVNFGGFFSGHLSQLIAPFAGLTPTAAGLYQINLVIPDDITPGPAVQLFINVNGVNSNVVNIAISPDGK